jgi:hypothetical protein
MSQKITRSYMSRLIPVMTTPLGTVFCINVHSFYVKITEKTYSRGNSYHLQSLARKVWPWGNWFHYVHSKVENKHQAVLSVKSQSVPLPPSSSKTLPQEGSPPSKAKWSSSNQVLKCVTYGTLYSQTTTVRNGKYLEHGPLYQVIKGHSGRR